MLYKKKWPLLIFVVPGLVFLFVFLYLPFVENIKNSFFDMTGVVEMPGSPWKFIQFDNYKKLFSDETIAIAIGNSFRMMGLTVVFEVGFAFILAVLVNNIRKGQQIFRTVFFFPIVISATAIGLLFKLFYNYNGGMLNQILKSLSLDPVNWLSPELAFLMICIPTLWSYVGFYFVILLTGLTNISDDIYEAADIDGCSKFKQVFYLTIPMMRPVIVTCVTLAVTGALKVFDLPWVIAANGAPQGLTHFLGTYMYQVTFGMNNYDYGSTIAIVIVVMGVVVSRLVHIIFRDEKKEVGR